MSSPEKRNGVSIARALVRHKHTRCIYLRFGSPFSLVYAGAANNSLIILGGEACGRQPGAGRGIYESKKKAVNRTNGKKERKGTTEENRRPRPCVQPLGKTQTDARDP